MAGLKTKFGARSTAVEVTEGIDLTGKVVIITGANVGIGKETARVLALRGADVVLAVRSVEGGEKVKVEIEEEERKRNEGGREGEGERGVKCGSVRVLPLDLSSFASVREFVGKFEALELPLHVLINNAGVMETPFQLTAAGHELQFATNHLGHFLLTQLLLPKLKASAGEGPSGECRVVNLSSLRHHNTYPQGIRFDLLDSPDGYSPLLAYGQSKLANILHAKELTRRLREEGVNVTVNAVHPGVILTNLLRHLLPEGSIKRTFFMAAYHVGIKVFFKSIPQGAATTCFVAVHPSLASVSGKYFVDCQEAEPSTFAKNEEIAQKLWDVSEKLTQEV